MPDHPDTLAKFAQAECAYKILDQQSLRWSAPVLFSDPFELNHRTALAFDPQTLLQSVIRTSCGMIFAREEPRGNSPLATVIRRWRDEERFSSPEEAEEVLGELMARMVDQRQEEIDETMGHWRLYTRSLRICSFSAKADNLTAWQYFADEHRGAVLKFQCGDDSCLPHPKPVRYNQTRPEITTLKEQLNVVLYNEKLRPQEYFEDKFLLKQPSSKNEQEWRCLMNVSPEDAVKTTDEKQWFTEVPFASEHLRSVYLGAFMPVETKKQFLELVSKKYPNTKIFQAEPVAGKYEIEFTRITLNS
ncbi:DUF2971 domain-containing protein [Gilvimarinus agarilyticus]|uniref:DUF2971 domain-containing protein n=1 Tax=unclassified Gilvimarinus TaxID=2642066 RepID=UPI001C08E2DA|nr:MULTISPECIES: DUF2971 domain-containing protein [unclassified Gilvimarinus]MBU2884641.1 DUF2971 domain-containing protein [Gilvimarinus agarilyticus]MDO6569748.1 DUF2971 domain-containing protein [Gilvimarinus sp. 2_MG-2023]MDO6747438.1 DUF2971 domain-containing protein [Gilvimarinus sp. 1_MG-2023]